MKSCIIIINERVSVYNESVMRTYQSGHGHIFSFKVNDYAILYLMKM